MLGRWSIDGVFTMRRIPREHQEWAQKKQIEAIKTFFATILVALVFVLVMYLAGYSGNRCMPIAFRCFALGLLVPVLGTRMACKLAVVARRDLQMSAGKLAAQVGHAVHDAVMGCPKAKLESWEDDGSMIVVLQADSEAELKELQSAATRLKLQSFDVQDEGLTEVEDETFTVLAIGPDASNRVDMVTGTLKLYADAAAAARTEAAELRERLAAAEAELATLRAKADL